MDNGKYLKIYEETRNDIVEGVYPKGSKLPSKRVMAESKNVSVITVSHAYELLLEEGYITAIEKSGYFIIYDKEQGFDTPSGLHKAVAHESNRLDSFNRDESAFSFAIYAKTARRVLTDYAEEIMINSPGFGTDRLRSAIAGYLVRSRHIRVLPEQIIIGAGAEYLYGLIVETFGRNLMYGIESPSYKKIEAVYRAGGVSVDMLPLSNDGIDSIALLSTEACVLHISPYRSFPSGVMASASKKREYIKWSEKRNAIIIEDDYESEFSPLRKPEETLFSLDREGRVIYLNTFSQTIGGFLRTSYMVIPERMVELFTERVGFHACPVPTLEQLIIAELIENGDFERHINRVRRLRRKK